MSELIKPDAAYRQWITEISRRFKQSQIKAALKVNAEMLRFYRSLGRDIHNIKTEKRAGNEIYHIISADLQNELPDVKSFSPTNLKYMQYFYEMYLSPQVGDLNVGMTSPQLGDYSPEQKTRPQVGDDFREIFCIPWGHNKLIIDKCKGNRDKALFYVRETLKNNWSRAMLLNFLDTDLYERQGGAVTNFRLTLPSPQSELAQQITKDPYNFDFLTLTKDYNEKELKDALMDNITKFLLELGNGFAFVGREYRIEIGSTENFIDMLFYNINLHCYVVIEVKITEFEASYTGQLGTYVVAVNHQLKSEQDGPTLGLLVCKNKDDVKAAYALEASSQPLGVSEYELSRLIPEEFKGTLPTIEEIESELKDEGEEDAE